MQPQSLDGQTNGQGLPPVPPVMPMPAMTPAPEPAPMPVQPQPVAAPQPAAAAAPSATPEIADDGDLIEKDWVVKVKQIIGSMAHDPYEQNKQFTQLKADYMQKRYGKVIKSEE